MRNIGAEIKQDRLEAKMSQQNVADLMGWHVSKVCRVEKNLQSLTAEEYFEVKDALKARRVAKFNIRVDGRLARV